MDREKFLSSKRIYDGRILNVRVDNVSLPNGHTTTREVIEHCGAAAVVALDDKNRVLMVRQFRYPMAQELLELPAGKMDPGETPEQCARRELMEETGCGCKTIEYLGPIYPAAAYLTEVVHLFFTDTLTGGGEQHLDEDEFLSVERIDVGDAISLAADGKLPDSKTQIGLLRLALMLKGR